MVPDSQTASQLTAAVTPTSSPTFRSFQLEVLSGPDAGTSFTSEGEVTVVGTHRSADLVLTDRTISRFHCELTVTDDCVRIRDLDSRNGTHLDEVGVDAARLYGPVILRMGRTEIRFELRSERARVQVAGQERFGPLIGRSPSLRAAFAKLQHAATNNLNVVIEGEAGTGKDAAAATIHEESARRDGPLDVVDCSGTEAEVGRLLFGKGDRPGALERCHGGTLVLDDLGALADALQRRLLRVINGGSVRRIDGAADRDADVRLIGLTRRNLRLDVNADRFRADLYYGIAIAHVSMPPLRQCVEDMPLFVAHILEVLGEAEGPTAVRLRTADAIEELRRAPWPGNMRELRRHIERVLASAGRGVEQDDDGAGTELPLIDGSVPLRDARRRWVRYFERSYLEDLLARTDGNVSAAARIAGVDRVHIHRLIARTGLRDDD